MSSLLAGSVRLEVGTSPVPGYVLKTERGRGAQGTVWEAMAADGTRAAIKFLPARSGPQVVQELKNLQAMKEIVHPNLIRIRGIWSTAGYIAVAMDLADGSLQDILRISIEETGDGVSAANACDWLRQAAEALDYMNGIGLRRIASGRFYHHCDIKPSNLLLVGETVKVSDFGLSKASNTGTFVGSSGGTLEFCPPEVFEGRVSLHSDQFALGVTYFLFRTGKFPFKDTPKEFGKPCARTAPNLASLPLLEQGILRRALHPQPERRWVSCGEFMNEMVRVVSLAAA